MASCAGGIARTTPISVTREPGARITPGSGITFLSRTTKTRSASDGPAQNARLVGISRISAASSDA
jgi:hypothetical protein